MSSGHWKFLKYLLIQVWLIMLIFVLGDQGDGSYADVSCPNTFETIKISDDRGRLWLKKFLDVKTEVKRSLERRIWKARDSLWYIDVVGSRRTSLHGAPDVLDTRGLSSSIFCLEVIYVVRRYSWVTCIPIALEISSVRDEATVIDMSRRKNAIQRGYIKLCIWQRAHASNLRVQMTVFFTFLSNSLLSKCPWLTCAVGE